MDHIYPGARPRFSARLSSRSASSMLASRLQRKRAVHGGWEAVVGQMIWFAV